DGGAYADPSGIAYARRTAEVVAMQRKFDRLVDEMLAAERRETAERSHAVLLVVPFFLSSFYVMAAKPMIIQQLGLAGRALVVALALIGVVYLIKNLAIVLARYTYKVPDHLTSVFREETPPDKPISRRAGLVFLISGYIVSLGLGHIVSNFLPLRLGSALSLGALLGVLIYPPIAVLIIGSIRRLGVILDRV
ncbi:MAG TPA: hypothetical protein VNO70_00325, partial [Blastocatellia bacterium]|nr:hypothetical protein [Blastocatellia bacterium]